MDRRLYLPVLSVGIIFLFTRSSCHKSLPDTQLGNWIGAASIPGYPRGLAVSFVIGDTAAYVGTGFNQSIGNPYRLSDFFVFKTNVGWTQVEDMPGPPRSNAVGFSLDGYGYVGTGFDGLNIYNDFYQYDPVANQWNPKASFPGGARYDAVGFGLQHKGYIGTGYNANWMNDFYQYDPSSNSWTTTPGTSGDFSKRRAASVFLYNNKAYIVAGSNSAGMAYDFWSFDPSAQTPWQRLNNINNTFNSQYTDIQREYASVFVNGTMAYLLGGRNGSMSTSTWAYDPSQDLWSRRTPYPRSNRYGAIAFTINNQSYYGSGYDGNTNSYDDFLQFQPNVPYNPTSLTN